MASSYGQGALLGLAKTSEGGPSSPATTLNSLASYELPRTWVHEDDTTKRLSDDEGLRIFKASKTGKLSSRRLAFSPDRRSLIVTSHRIKSIKSLWSKVKGDSTTTVLWLDDIVGLQTGTVSSRFLTAANVDASLQQQLRTDVLLECQDQCLTIVSFYKDNNSKNSSSTRTLDLVVPDRRDFERLVQTLTDLLQRYQLERKRTIGPLQHVLYHWHVTLKKSNHDVISSTEWTTLCDTLQVPLPRSLVHTMFTQDAGDMEGLTLCETGRLLQDVQDAATELVTGQTAEEIDPLELLWNRLAETDPVPSVGVEDDEEATEVGIANESSISNVAVLSFCRSQQKEFQATLPRVTKLFQTLNQQVSYEDLERDADDDTSEESSQDKDDRKKNRVEEPSSERISKSRFLSFLLSDANDLMDPLKGKPLEDMTQPLSAYWINTSHDTYLAQQPPSWRKSAYFDKNNNKSGPELVDEQSYMLALLRGVRCLELDVWEDVVTEDEETTREPVVARHEPTESTPVLALQTVLRIVRTFLEQYPDTFPILLNIENHVISPDTQLVMARMLFEELHGKIATLETHRDAPGLLPSPKDLIGKVVIMGKRPITIKDGALVLQDDYDEENDKWQIDTAPNSDFWDDAEEVAHNNTKGVVVGFSTKGPIRSGQADELVRTPSELLEIANQEATDASNKAREAVERAAELQSEATLKESLAAELTRKTGMTPEEVKARAARAADRHKVLPSSTESFDDYVEQEEQKSPKDEGLEVQEFLSEAVEDGRDAYAQAAQDAMEAARNVAAKKAKLRDAEEALKRTEQDLEMSKQREKDMAEQARKAAAEARSNREHADAAKERVEKVRELLRNCADKSSNAGTVVVTAMTEAKISEKRAAEAENRASRATATAERDRQRADDETKKEEQLEHEVAALHKKYGDTMEEAVSVRERVEKAAAMLDRVNEQIKLIERSSQFQKERIENQGKVGEAQSPRHTGSFMAKHKAKLEERDICRELIKEASEENSAAEIKRKNIQETFEEKAHMLRNQADHAASLRKQADRSLHVAEDLAEQADEEREAATLRQIARQKAEATVENRDSHRESAEAQLAEAERASSEAAKIAVQSRRRAERLEKDLEKLKDHSRFEQAVEQQKWELNQCKGEYDAAKLEKERKDAISKEEKHRLDTNSGIYTSAVKDASHEIDRAKVAPILDQEAIVAYNQALLLRKEAELATQLSKSASHTAKQKTLAAQRALEYKEKMDMMTEIPAPLAKLTMLHTTKHRNWAKSLSLSSVHVHSFAQNILLHMVESDHEQHRSNFHAFTKRHLCRVFPSWKILQSKTFSNYDPVFAWTMGCQLVSMNFSSADESLLVADGRFRQNGSCGYVLKPESLLGETTSKETQLWSFAILSGYRLPKTGKRSVVSPFVRVSLYEGSTKAKRTMYNTKPVRHNGLNPIWDETEVFDFYVTNPSIAMVSFSVWDKMDDGREAFIAGASMPVSCLREGYRSVALFDANHSKNGPYAFSSLLVRATKR